MGLTWFENCVMHACVKIFHINYTINMHNFVFMFSIQKIYLTKNQQSLTKQAIFQQQGSLQY